MCLFVSHVNHPSLVSFNRISKILFVSDLKLQEDEPIHGKKSFMLQISLFYYWHNPHMCSLDRLKSLTRTSIITLPPLKK